MDEVKTYISKYTDEELMNLVVERNSNALKILYERYSRGIFNFTLRYTNNREISEDVLQETFTRAWFAAHTFNAGKGTVKTWLFTIGINLTRNEMSKKRYEYDHLELDAAAGHRAKTEMKENSLVEKTEIEDAIANALSKLNPFLKEVIILKHFHNMKFAEIAEMTNTPVGTLKARFHNAIARLRELLKEMEF